MSKIISSHNLSEFEQLNYSLSKSLLLFELSFNCYLDSERNNDDDKANSACSLVFQAMDMFKSCVDNYFLFDKCLHSEVDFSSDDEH